MAHEKNVWFLPDCSRSSIIDYENRDSIVRYLIDNMYLKSLEIFKYNGLPETIPEKVLEYQLQKVGYTTIFEHEGKVYASYGGLGGVLNYNYLPTVSIVANPYLRISKTFKIDEDCVVGKNDFLYIGMEPTHSLYAQNLADGFITARLNRINARAEYVFNARDDDDEKSIEEFYEGLKQGKLKSVQSNAFLKDVQTLPLASSGSSRITTSIIEDLQYNKASWWNEIGVMANYNMKRESITSNESQLNESALLPFVDQMMFCRKEMVDKMNKMFGLSVSVDFSSTWKNLRRENELALDLKEKETEQGEEKTVITDEGDKDEKWE